MLSTKLGGVNRAALLSIALAASVVAASAAYSFQEVRITSLSSELADRSRAIELQNQELEQYTMAIAAQKLEIEDRVAKLQDLNLRIDVLAAEITSKDAEVNGLSATVAMQNRELQVLRSEAVTLQGEITLLEEQLGVTQEKLDSAKRIQVKHYGVGVDQDNAGVVFPIEVEIIGAGDGTISVDVRNVQYEASFQTAVRTAAAVASEYTGVSTGDKDIIVTFINDDGDSDIIKVDGPSAGALITGMIIAGLTDQQIQPSVLVTGAIQPDGKIGAIGSIMTKTDAAVNFGATTMLVPKSQEFQHERIQVVGVSDIKEVVNHLIKP